MSDKPKPKAKFEWSSKGPSSPPKVTGWLWWTEPKDRIWTLEAVRKEHERGGRER